MTMKRSELKQLIKEIIKASVNEAPMHVSKTDPEVANKFKQQVDTIVSKSKMYLTDVFKKKLGVQNLPVVVRAKDKN